MKYIRFLRSISITGIIAGGLTSLVLGTIVTTPLYFYFYISKEDLTNIQRLIAIASNMSANMPAYLTMLLAGSLCYIPGGYVAAWIGRRAELLNAVLSVLTLIILEIIFCPSPKHEIEIINLIAVCLLPFFGLFGGYLRQLRRKSLPVREEPIETAVTLENTFNVKAFITGYFKNLKCGLRVLFFMRTDAARLSISLEQFFAVVFTGLLVNAVIEYFESGIGSHFEKDGLPFYLASSALLAAAALPSIFNRRLQQHMLLFPTLLAGMFVFYSIIFMPIPWELYGIQRVLKHKEIPQIIWQAIRCVTTLWLFIAFIVCTVRLIARKADGEKNAIRIYAVIMAIWIYVFPPYGIWFFYPESSAITGERGKNQSLLYGEDIFQVQPALFRKAVASLQPERPGYTDLYFMGVAPYFHQDVFMKEVTTIDALFKKRFDTTGRSLLLVNNLETISKQPIATTANIENGLKEIGRRMNVGEDILFLYFTSHGSKEQGLSMNLGFYQIKDLGPAKLRSMLDKSGILWRVVVISGCYSGTFIPALKDDHTLVITSADADHTSFGCSNENDMTDFAKAYFIGQLTKSRNFVTAFDKAKEVVKIEEDKAGFGHSNPQIAVGKLMDEKLAAFRKQLSRK